MADNMYANTKTWNPARGCEFDCTYCEPSFKRQARRIGKKGCQDCFHFRPHCHEDRLAKIPSAENIFVCSMGDISFCPEDFMLRIIRVILQHNGRCKRRQTFLMQSKRPEYFGPFLDILPGNVILGTTLETNRHKGYGEVSKAPPPLVRYYQFRDLKYRRKYVTIEPVFDFDLTILAECLLHLHPEHVWVGFNSRPKSVQLPEPSPEKVMELMQRLADAGIEVRGKNLQGLEIPNVA